MQETTSSFTDNLPRIQSSELEADLSKNDLDELRSAIIVQLRGEDHSAVISIELLNGIIEAMTDLTRPTSVLVEDLPEEIKAAILNSMPTDEEVENNRWSDGRQSLS